MTAEDDTSFELLLQIQTFSDEQLKEMAERLAVEEREVSKRRRILHGEIDIIRAEMVRRKRDKHRAGESIVSDGDIGRLADILSGRVAPPTDTDQA
jgi:hypothetical protein